MVKRKIEIIDADSESLDGRYGCINVSADGTLTLIGDSGLHKIRVAIYDIALVKEIVSRDTGTLLIESCESLGQIGYIVDNGVKYKWEN